MPNKYELEEVQHALDIEEHLDVHRWGWRLESVLAGIVLIAVVLALAGLFGDGRLSRATATAGGVQLQYERFARFGKDMSLNVRAAEGVTQVSFPAEYFRRFRLQRIVPQPQSESALNGRTVFQFEGAGAESVRFHLQPDVPGRTRAAIDVDGAHFDISHWTYP